MFNLTDFGSQLDIIGRVQSFIMESVFTTFFLCWYLNVSSTKTFNITLPYPLQHCSRPIEYFHSVLPSPARTDSLVRSHLPLTFKSNEG